MGTLTTVVDDGFIKSIDKVIKSTKLYSSRSEFLKDAVREKFEELVMLDPDLRRIRLASQKLARKAIARGWDGSLITRADKERAHRELMKEKGFI